MYTRSKPTTLWYCHAISDSNKKKEQRGELLNANDIAIIRDSQEELENSLESFRADLESVGPRINVRRPSTCDVVTHLTANFSLRKFHYYKSITVFGGACKYRRTMTCLFFRLIKNKICSSVCNFLFTSFSIKDYKRVGFQVSTRRALV